MKRAVLRLVGSVLLVASSIIGFSGVLNAIGVAPWVDAAGPGGGTVYYYDANGFSCGVDLTSTCHFLEVAGSDWNAKNRSWSSNRHSVPGTSTAIGSGAKNTSLIVAGNSTLGYAASDANAFVSNTGLGDWFLPSKDEAFWMDGASYSTDFGEVGTSSEVQGNASWWHTYQSRDNLFPSNSPKVEAFRVLAVRAFSKSDSSLASVSVAGEVLTPGFDPSVTSYSVSTSESSVQLTAVAVGASSVLVGASSGSSSVGNGTQSAPISLDEGLNQVTVTVTAADSTSTTYVLDITREIVVAYDGNGATGGSVPSTQTKTDGVYLTLASNSGSLVREGYTFAGWNTRADGDGTAYAEGATYAIDAGVTLYAAWTANSLTVTFDSQGGTSVPDAVTTTGGVLAEAPTAPTRDGFTFDGWFAASSGGAAITFPYTHGQTANFTLYAQWTVRTYVVSYDGNGATGGSVPSTQTKTDGVYLTLASNSGSLVREGYTFADWNTAADGSGTTYAEGATYSVDAGVTLYAAWTASSLTVTFDAQGGTSVPDAVTTTGGVLAEAPTAPTRSGYRFLGWFATSSGGTAITFPYTHGQTANFTLYAQWVQSSLDGLGSVTKIGTITTTDGIGNTFSADTPSSSVSVRYPADGLPANTVIDIYLVNDMTRAQSLVPAGGGYVVSLVVAWLAADGSVPLMADGKPISMTITNATIEAGAKTYAIVGGVVTLLGEASVDGSVTISITEDPEIVVVNPAAVPAPSTTTTTSTTAAPSTPSPTTTAPSTTTTTAAPSIPSPTTTTPSPVSSPPVAEQPNSDEIESTPSGALGSPGVVQPGESVRLSYGGFVSGSRVDVYFASTPRFLGSTTTDARGRVALTIAIPRGIEGQHSIVLFEPSTGRLVRQVIVVVPLSLPVTGATETTGRPVTIALFLLVFGALAASGASSRRRRNGCQHGWREIDDVVT